MKHQKSKKLVVTNLNAEGIKASKKFYDKMGLKLRKRKKSKKPVAMLLNFTGDVYASAVDDFSVAVSLACTSLPTGSKVYIKLESGGGTVNGYGLLAYEIKRLRAAQLHVVVLIDKVAASGGYLAACVADTVIAAPFAYVGSIGVVSEMLNYNNFLDNHGIGVEQHTAGSKKRSITPLGRVTAEAREVYTQKLKDIHQTFIEHVKEHRPMQNLSKENEALVFSGDYWLASESYILGLYLVDTIMTSSAFLQNEMKTNTIMEVTFDYKVKKPWFGVSVASIVDAVFSAIDQRVKGEHESNNIKM